MGLKRRGPRWKGTALALLAAETAALFWAYYAFNVGDRLRSVEQTPAFGGLVAQGLSGLLGILPSPVLSSILALGAGIGFSAGFGMLGAAGRLVEAGIPASSGSAVIVPVYFAVRRLLRGDRMSHRSLSSRTLPGSGVARAKVHEPFVSPSTAVQEGT